MNWMEFFIFSSICDLFRSKDSDYEYDSYDDDSSYMTSDYNSDQLQHSKTEIDIDS